jgi:hypothetical protein
MGAIEVGRMVEVGPHSYADSTDGWVLVARNVAYSSDEIPPRWPWLQSGRRFCGINNKTTSAQRKTKTVLTFQRRTSEFLRPVMLHFEAVHTNIVKTAQLDSQTSAAVVTVLLPTLLMPRFYLKVILKAYI